MILVSWARLSWGCRVWSNFYHLSDEKRHTVAYFIRLPAAEYATQKTNGNLTRLSPLHIRVWPARLI